MDLLDEGREALDAALGDDSFCFHPLKFPLWLSWALGDVTIPVLLGLHAIPGILGLSSGWEDPDWSSSWGPTF